MNLCIDAQTMTDNIPHLGIVFKTSVVIIQR